MGVYPLHSSTVGLIWNLNTNHTSPQFLVVYDNLFQTVHSSEGKPPAKWPYFLIFDHFCSDFDESYFVLELSYEWLTPVDLAQHREVKLNHRNQATYQDGDTP